MTERKPWTQQEDQILRDLKQVRKIPKWSQISHIMKTEFQIIGRNGKQCRQRFHNHLDSRISKQKWGIQQEKKLIFLHNQWGNRWAAISRELPGRTDNCVKNHFYSCFRKSIKNVNNFISANCKKKFRFLKLTIINKIVSVIQAYHKDPQTFDKTIYNEAKDIKSQILNFSDQETVSKEDCLQILEKLSQKLTIFNKASRNKQFKKKKVKLQQEDSEQICKKNQEDGQQNQNENINRQKFTKIKREPEINFSPLKIQIRQPLYHSSSYPESNSPKKQQQFNKQQVQNGKLIQKTPQKQKKQQKQKNSSYFAVNSVDYLDIKHNNLHDVKDFIFMDQDKEWKLYFE